MIRLIKTRLSARLTGLIIGIVIIVGYAAFETHDLVLGPKLSVLQPTEEIVTSSDPTIMIKGQAKRIATIHLNGQQIFTDKDGEFDEEVVLLPGYNILRLDTEDKFGRRISKRFQVWRDSPTNFN